MDRTIRIPSVTGIDVELRIAGPGGRSFAFVIDWHIRVLIALAWMIAAGSFYPGGIRGIAFADTIPPYVQLVVVLPATALYLLYHPVLEVLMRGRTPGKRMAGVRIVKRDGGVPGSVALLVRNIFRLIDFLPFFYFVGLVTTMLTRHCVRLGDIAAGTLLVYDEADPATFDDAPSSRGIERLGLERAELVRDLITRWPQLSKDARTSLARRLLEREGLPSEDLGDDELRERLEQLVS